MGVTVWWGERGGGEEGGEGSQIIQKFATKEADSLNIEDYC